MKSNDVMVDLETLGNRAGCQVLSIGACFFSRQGKQKIGAKFYGLCKTGRGAQTKLGLHIDDSTIKWWRGQSPDARVVLEQSKLRTAPTLACTLDDFAQWLVANAADATAMRVWGNGSDFDNAILYAAFNAIGLACPWKYYNSRCFRTLKSEFGGVQAPRRKGTHHNALDDAVHQARHAAAIFRSFVVLEPPPRRGI